MEPRYERRPGDALEWYLHLMLDCVGRDQRVFAKCWRSSCSSLGLRGELGC